MTARSQHESDFREWLEDQNLSRDELVEIEKRILDCEALTLVSTYELLLLVKSRLKAFGEKREGTGLSEEVEERIAISQFDGKLSEEDAYKIARDEYKKGKSK